MESSGLQPTGTGPIISTDFPGSKHVQARISLEGTKKRARSTVDVFNGMTGALVWLLCTRCYHQIGSWNKTFNSI